MPHRHSRGPLDAARGGGDRGRSRLPRAVKSPLLLMVPRLVVQVKAGCFVSALPN